MGTFDVVLFCGVLYHLRYPLLGLDNVRRVCRGEVYLETYVSDPELVATLGDAASSLPIWQFYRGAELSNDESNWFGPTACAVVQALESAGFSVEHATTRLPKRAAFRASVKVGYPEFLTMRTGEGAYYETILSPLCGDKSSFHVSPEQLSLFGRPPKEFHFEADRCNGRLRTTEPAAPKRLLRRARSKVARWLNAA
jgi:hypothetical protein